MCGESNVQVFPPEFQIVPMKPQHIKKIAEIGVKSGFTNWNEEDYQREIECKDSQCLVIVLAGAAEKSVIGFSLTRLIPPEAEILNIAVEESYRKRGMGTALLNKIISELCIRRIELVWLEVRVSNLAAKNMYIKKGFGLAGTRRSYYSNPVEDAELMLYKCNQS
jgi:ribosomal-protein-alanine N-acetyltransferase